ncbi:hypothetical protein PIB30_117149 [Stylosanthes scabra]|uniref:Uncharacterized protein n=1 Tax=Stylosanthes scabra TaxID=79078 RepID=A0ABU6SD21_9FABA|nr:hypothetical protein [Stylosanthes scabra]
MQLTPELQTQRVGTRIEKRTESNRIRLSIHTKKLLECTYSIQGPPIKHGIGNISIPSGQISVRHFIKHLASINKEASFAVHIESTAPYKDIRYHATLQGKGVNLFSGDRNLKRRRSLEDAGESEVVGRNALAAHVREVEEGIDKMGIANAAEVEGGPGDDGASGGEREDALGGGEVVEFGVHVNEMVA